MKSNNPRTTSNFTRRNAAATVGAFLLLGAAPAAARTYAYVPNSSDDTVAVIDTNTNAVVANITVGPGTVNAAVNNPVWAAATPDGRHIYVTNIFGNNVAVINTSTNTVATYIPVGNAPEGVAVSPDGTQVYVTNLIDGTISVISPATNTVVATFAAGSFPAYVAFSDNAHAYVTNATTNTVSVINTASRTVTQTIAVGATPVGIAVSGDGRQVYVTNSGDGTVSIIGTWSNTVWKTVSSGPQVPNGSLPNAVAFNLPNTEAWVTNGGSDTYPDNTIGVIATNPFGFPALNRVLTTGQGPDAIGFAPNGLAYAPNFTDNTVSVFNATTHRLVTTISVGNNPIGVALVNR